MKPPECTVCGVNQHDKATEFDLVWFRPHEIHAGLPLEAGSVGHPSHAAWFCADHVNTAHQLCHLTLPEAEEYLDNLANWRLMKDIEEAVLRHLVKTILSPDNPSPAGSRFRRELITNVTDHNEISETDVESALARLYDRFLVDERQTQHGSVVEVTADGLEKFHEASDQPVILLDDLWDIMAHCYHTKRRSPEDPTVSRNTLQRETVLTEDRIDLAVWYLVGRGLLKPTAGHDGDWWGSVEITDAGKQLTNSSYIHTKARSR